MDTTYAECLMTIADACGDWGRSAPFTKATFRLYMALLDHAHHTAAHFMWQ